MKQAKKIFAIIIAAAMVLSMGAITAFASLPQDANVSGDGTFTGGDAFATEIFSVVVPTAKGLNFILDPLGLAGYGIAGTSLDELADSEFAGKIVHNGVPATVINESSVAVKVTVGIVATGDAVIVQDKDLVEKDDKGDAVTANNILLSVGLSEDAVKTTSQAFTPGSAYAIEKEASADAGPGADDQLVFVLEAGKYDVAQGVGGFMFNFVPGSGNGTQFAMGGLLNRNADWADYAKGDKKVGVAAVFKFAKATVADENETPVGGAYGLIDVGDNFEVFAGGGTGKIGFTSDTATFTINQTVTVPFNYGDYTIVSVTSNGTAISTSGTNRYRSTEDDRANNEIAFTFGSATVRTIVVTLSGDGGTSTAVFSVS
ncbi:MAG: hypothetical protein FWH20_04290 [Oscillospiraceae bacterium]|nr:hypothetical protein [Oscillospiraceae bacterium]